MQRNSTIKNSEVAITEVCDPVGDACPDYDFPMRPRNIIKPIAWRKRVYGVGINDAKYKTRILIDGVYIRCPVYALWVRMLRRCYAEELHAKKPTYADCTVAEVWHRFTTFRRWVLQQPNWKDWHLDKDLIQQGNKVYAPHLCLFVPNAVNTLFSDPLNPRYPGYPLGVRKAKSGRYEARLKRDNVEVYLGMFDTPEEAHQVWRAAKRLHAIEVAHRYTGRVRRVVLRCAEEFA